MSVMQAQGRALKACVQVTVYSHTKTETKWCSLSFDGVFYHIYPRIKSSIK